MSIQKVNDYWNKKKTNDASGYIRRECYWNTFKLFIKRMIEAISVEIKLIGHSLFYL